MTRYAKILLPVVATIVLAGLFGVAGVTYALGYVKEQQNVSALITETVAGKLPPAVLDQALKTAGAAPGLFGGATDLLKWGAIAAALVIFFPLISAGVKRVTP